MDPDRFLVRRSLISHKKPSWSQKEKAKQNKKKTARLCWWRKSDSTCRSLDVKCTIQPSLMIALWPSERLVCFIDMAIRWSGMLAEALLSLGRTSALCAGGESSSSSDTSPLLPPEGDLSLSESLLASDECALRRSLPSGCRPLSSQWSNSENNEQRKLCWTCSHHAPLYIHVFIGCGLTLKK